MIRFLEQLIAGIWNRLRGRGREARRERGTLSLGSRVLDGQITRHPVTLSNVRRTMHVAVLGKTGTGKSSLLRYLAEQDIQADRGFLYFDLHGDTTPFLLRTINARERQEHRHLSDKLILIEPADPIVSVGPNPLEQQGTDCKIGTTYPSGPYASSTPAKTFLYDSTSFSCTPSAGLAVIGCQAQISFVQVAEATPQSSVSVTYAQSQTAGDLNIVVVGWNDTTATVQSVTDTQGNTYTLAVGPLKGTALTQSIYYAKNIRGGTNSVTATFSQAAVFPDIRIVEYKGLSTTTPFDKAAQNSGTSGNNASVSSGSATTTSANELIFGSAITNGAFTTAGTGFTKEVIDSDGNIVEDETVSSTGSYAATATLGAYGNQNWIMQMATFIASSGGSAPTVISISPNSGTTAGGTPVTITGTGFISGSTVTIGGTAATSVTVVSSTSITATTPAHAAGAATVVVSNSNGSGQLTNGFTYTTGSSSIGFVQVAESTPQTPQTSVSASYSLSQTAGNLNIVVVGWNDTTAAVQSVTDTQGNTYILATGPLKGTALTQSIYYAKNIRGGTNTVTATFSPAAAFPDVRITEYQGLSTTSPLDKVAGTAGTSGNNASVSSGAATTTSANELIFGSAITNGAFTTAGTGFTKEVIDSDGNIVEDETVSSTGSYAATATLGAYGSQNWIMQMATFVGSSGGGSAPTVISISPNSGTTAGGTPVTIAGTGFISGSTVTIGGAAATSVTVVSSTTITATTPAHAAGAATVVVSNSNGSGQLTNGYTYTTAPTPVISSISPDQAPVGMAVTISGSNFGASRGSVTFNGTAASPTTWTATSITVNVPSGATSGNVIVTAGGVASAGYSFTVGPFAINLVNSVTYSPTNVPVGYLTQVVYGSGDSDNFTPDPNTGRMKSYQFSAGASTDTGTLNWNPNGTLGSLQIADQITPSDSQTCQYAYDDLSRIASYSCPTFSQGFAYDPFGNITKSGSFLFQPGYMESSNHEVGVSYDADGNPMNDQSFIYTYDSDGHPITIAPVGGATVTYVYDALGRVVESQASANVETVYDPTGGKIATVNGSTLNAGYVGLTGGGTAVWSASGLSFYRHADWQGSSRLATTQARTMYSDQVYAPFGETQTSSGTADLVFAGLPQINMPGLYDAANREYSAAQGRWPAPDPAGLGAVDPTNPQSWNRYAYALNNPLSYVDPTGLFCQWDPDTNGVVTNDETGDPDTGTQGQCEGLGGTWIPDNGTFTEAFLGLDSNLPTFRSTSIAGNGDQESTAAAVLNCTIETSNKLTITNALSHLPGVGQYLKPGSWGRTAVDIAGGGNAVTGLLDAGRTFFGNSASGKDLAQTTVGVVADPSLGLNPIAKAVGLAGQGAPSVAPDIVEGSAKVATTLAGASAEVAEDAATGVGFIKLGIDAVLTVGSGGYCFLTQ
jgi:RHS repeat-associated protein